MANRFETEVSRSFKVRCVDRHLPPHWEGSPYFYTRLLVHQTGRTLFSHKEPCDALVDVHPAYGRNLALELKETNGRPSFPFERVPAHQENGLRVLRDAGRVSILLLRFKHRGVTEVWALPICLYLQLKLQEEAKGKKSLSLALVREHGLPVPTARDSAGNKVWDITSLSLL